MMKKLHLQKSFFNNNLKKNALVFLFSLFIINSISGQSADCNNAAGSEITVENDCTSPITWNVGNNTKYWQPVVPNTYTCGAGDFDDLWGWFTATSTSTTITYDPAGTRDAVLTLFDGTAACNPDMGSLDCANAVGGGLPETIVYATIIGTRYRVRVQRVGSNVTMNGDLCVYNTVPTYCLPSSTDTTNYIDDFTTTGATGNITHTGTGFSSGGYGDFTSMIISQTAGSAINFNIDFEGGTYETNIWVDWNRDLDFDDANEKVFQTTGYSDPTAGSFTVLAGTSGNYRMRVRSDWFNADPSPCGFDEESETHDYTLFVGVPSPCTSPTTQPSSLNFITVADISIAANFTASAPTSTNYLVLMNTTGTTPTPPTDTTTYAIGDTSLGATVIDNDGDTNFTATGLTPTTTYYFFIYAFNDQGCSGGPLYNTTSPLTGNDTTLAASYCIPSSTDSTNYIDDFITTGAITNINHTGTGFSTAGYGNFTSIVVEQFTGSNVDFTINFIGGTYETNIWVDWNNDADFDDVNEKVFETAGYSDPTIGSFTVLGSAAPGNYRMRVRSDWLNSDPAPCGYDDESETHDYTLTVTPLSCTDNPLSLTGTATSPTTGSISWTNPTPAPANGYEYIVSTDNTTGTPAGDITGTTTATTVNLTGLTAGTTYYVFVRGVCNAVDFGVWITTTFSTSCSNILTTPTVCPLISGEQGTDPFTATPFDPDPVLNMDCNIASITLEAHTNLRETTSYIVEQITYPSPPPVYDPPTLGGPTAQVISDDDVWADSWTTLPFNFCFYGNTYTQTLVGANGMITFDSAYTAGSSCGYFFNTDLPSIANDLFNNTIYGVYHDLDPRGLVGTPITSRVEGTVPGCRQFIIAWHDIPMFSDSTRLYTGMIVLHETSNIIEVFIEEKRIENGNVSPWNGGNAIVGIQGSAAASEATVAPCRNSLDTNWETTNEAWRFVPDGAPIAPTSVTWYSAGNGGVGPGLDIGSGTTYNATAPDTYTAEVVFNTCGTTVTLTDEVVVNQSSITWTGATDSNWYVATNWLPAQVPTAADCVLIPDTSAGSGRYPTADVSNRPPPIPPPSALALNLTVETNATLEVLADTELVVTNWINLDGTINIRNTGSLIQVTDGAPNVNNNTGSGNVNMQRTVSIASPYDYIYWSSPVENFGVSAVSPGSTYIYEWIPTIATNVPGGYGDWLPTTESMINGKGYIIRNISGTPSALTPEFVGRPNNGVITKAITRGTYTGADYAGAGGTMATAIDDNWNLVGNPYPSAISADTFISVNAAVITDDVSPAISGTVYLWRHLVAPSNAESDPFYGDFTYNYNPNDYIAYNSTGSNPVGFAGDIAAGQSFFVLMENTAPVATSNIVFNNTMRNETLDNSQFYRTEEANRSSSSDIEKHRIWLDLISSENTANSILVGYIEGATNDLDRLFDGFELSETNARFYSLIEDDEMAIQGKALPFEDTDTVPLGVVIPENGNYSIALNTLDGLFEEAGQAIYVEDTYTNIIHDLRINPYSFNIEPGTYNDRFILRYNNGALSLDEFDVNNGLEIIAPNNSYIKVTSGNSPINSITVYDLLGRVLIERKDINTSEFSIETFNYSEGAYIVKAVLFDGKQKIQKVVLKH